MSTSSKYIIPLLSDELTLEDINPENGFIDIYTNDINRPYLDNHIFLMYKTNAGNVKAFYRNKRLINNQSLYLRYYYVINNESYIVYAFPITSWSIKQNKLGRLVFGKDDILKIMKFWKCTDEDVNQYIANGCILSSSNYTPNTIPEQDFRLDVDYKQKSRGLSI